jgi:hypothetical protein
MFISLSLSSASISCSYITVVGENGSGSSVGEASNEFEVTALGEGSDLTNLCAFSYHSSES